MKNSNNDFIYDIKDATIIIWDYISDVLKQKISNFFK